MINQSIWVVGTNVRNRLEHVMTCQQHGYSVVDAGNFRESMMLLEQPEQLPSSIIIDVKFHPEQAVDFIQHVRNEMGYAEIFILVVCGQGKSHDDYGADCVLSRPIDEFELLSNIQ